MPRKAFIADLQTAITSFERNNITELKAGEEDGMIKFCYHMNDDISTEITILVPDLGEYPESHLYMFYTNSENVPQPIHSALDSMSQCQSMTVSDMMHKVSKTLDKASAGSRHNPIDVVDGDHMSINSGDEELDPLDDQDDYESDELGSWSPHSPRNHSSATVPSVPKDKSQIKATNSRIRQDLRNVKAAGFRVGYLGNLLDGGDDGFVTISCRVSKLGISDEALQTWHLEPNQYFMLIIRYSSGYLDLDRLLGSNVLVDSEVQMRVGLNDRYKIAIDEAIASFSYLEDRSKSGKLTKMGKEDSEKPKGLGRLFIGRPLEELLNDRLIPLLRYRLAMGLPWGGAEDFLNDHQGRNFSNEDAVDAKYWTPDVSHRLESLPSIVIRDHMEDGVKQRSFPLLAMQYALRHLVRCTEFCLVCHCKVEADFEALKPYVCSKPLCLYQYMSLGFGPSIEHEILTQPHVVDLLISFCYTSATYQKLRYLPTGMALMVPSPDTTSPIPTPFSGFAHGSILRKNRFEPQQTQPRPQPQQNYKARFDQPRMELLFDTAPTPILHVGNWLTFQPPGSPNLRYHCRVIEVLYPIVRLGPPVTKVATEYNKSDASSSNINQQHLSETNTANTPSILTPATTPLPTPQIEFTIYDQNFDEFDDISKQCSIVMLLDTLPSVLEMAEFLRKRGGQDTSLRAWADRISPAGLGLLRWIIASNRSCIIQVDNLDGSARKLEDRVSGMPGWMQFRFAQGAPDKEQRFITSVRNTTSNFKYPTLFAWHGSPLYNWHGIVREGLHFERIDHGRAFGNGCYHSLSSSTSLGYSGGHYGGNDNKEAPARPGVWPRSQLQISSAIALNEIVNAPSHFVRSSPHIVVAQLDWIQSRYLFVQCRSVNVEESIPSQIYEQDPAYTSLGEKGDPLIIPITAVSKSRRPASGIVKNGFKKVKVENVEDLEEAAMLSDESDTEDLELLLSDTEDGAKSAAASKGKRKHLLEIPSRNAPHVAKMIDFVPGKLDHSSLPLMEAPTFATPKATKVLQRELTGTLKVQDTHPLHELGWYIDRDLITNVYQWIVELHSFEDHLPLAKDLKSKNINSVVLEIRFGKDYPMSPPFVRVIRPRFLSFMQGGGGHVTAGGALCMELLTNSGWSAVSNIESVLLQVRLAMSSTEPKPARLEPGMSIRDYQVGEATEAFIRACHAHGWEVPPDFASMTYSGSSKRDQ
ncbi:hypothetical protein ACLMJK_007569 [Lecanora helva]